jgi:hypothetical protein
MNIGGSSSRAGSHRGSQAGSRGGSLTPPRSAVMVVGGSRTPARHPDAFAPPAGPISVGSPAMVRIIDGQYVVGRQPDSWRQLQSHSIQGVLGTVGQPIQAIVNGEVHNTFVGSQAAPLRLDINIVYPERNGALFFPIKVLNVPHGPMIVNKYTISYCGDYPDLNDFTMTIPVGDGGPGNRALLKMPSVAYPHRNMGATNISCEITKRAYMEAQNAIERDMERRSTYLMMNFPEELDNMIFSHNRTDVVPHLDLNMTTTPVSTGREQQDTRIYWDIAKRGAVDRIHQVAAKFRL